MKWDKRQAAMLMSPAVPCHVCWYLNWRLMLQWSQHGYFSQWFTSDVLKLGCSSRHGYASQREQTYLVFISKPKRLHSGNPLFKDQKTTTDIIQNIVFRSQSRRLTLDLLVFHILFYFPFLCSQRCLWVCADQTGVNSSNLGDAKCKKRLICMLLAIFSFLFPLSLSLWSSWSWQSLKFKSAKNSMAEIHRNWRQTHRKQTSKLKLWNFQEIFGACFSSYSLF